MCFREKYPIMKGKLLFLIFIFCFTLYSCDDSEKDILEVSQSSIDNISSDGATLEVDITSTLDWTVSKTAKWCSVTPQNGSGNQKLTLKIEPNLEEAKRNVTVTVAPSVSGISKTIKITQNGIDSPFNPEAYHYKLPVIFHVLYHDKNNNEQYVKVGRLPEILKRVNQLYRNAGTSSVNMNLEFVLATEDPNGKTLSEPGVERIEWKTAAIDINDFMFSNNSTYNYLIWEPNDYINIMVYKFTDDDVMGVSHFPYSPTAYPLAGTETVSYYLKGNNLQYAYCVSINNTYIYEDPSTPVPNQDDIAITLAHELGHYLGLYHVFSEATEDGVDVCEDTDYCTDTYTYDRNAYEAWITALSKKNDRIYFEDVSLRHDCVQNIEFTSRNIMDYAYSYLDEFTAQQKARVRHVLTYSPLIPGPKKGHSGTRALYDGPLDLPIRVMK